MKNTARVLLLCAIAANGACATSPSDVGEVDQAAINCSTAPAWATNTHYNVGDIVTFQGTAYQCVQAHTSQSDWTPTAVPALWQPATACGGGGGGTPPGGGGGSGGGGTPPGGPGGTAGGFVFSPYKDTSINMDFNTNVISTLVPGARTPLATDLTANAQKSVTLAFATGECGSENWGGVPGATLASVNASRLDGAGINYVLSTGGAAGSFSCGSDAGFATFINRWATSHLIGVDFDIEVGQSQAAITDLARRALAAHAGHPGLRFSFTIATLANSAAGESLNSTGVTTVQAIRSVFGNTLPSYVTVNLMTMDYGGPSTFVCTVVNGACDMGQSAITAARNLNSQHGIPFANIEITPMIGGNDVQTNIFRLTDANAVASFAIANHLAGVHYWSYDRDIDCNPGPASATCNSIGGAGAHGFLHRFQSAGLH